ncbi:ricin-type beta-trefoil lectin domain protein [Saccharothrix sp. ST-888]|uniref:ricin-type beta-trefoil lectin domain protein n=1 Tax=Saccharothrix sp. ST-888 TaxID=1427391 RepID=UPI000695F0CE|nr:ricin-type beta-trefoil lectin domain protein [Saccharothrix sp. ST-888]
MPLRRLPGRVRATALTAVISCLVALVGAFAVAPAAQAAVVSGPITGLAGKCLDDSGAGTADGNQIILWHCTGADNQTWTLPGDGTIRTLGKCLDATAGGTAAGTYADLYTCNGQGRQQWAVRGTTLVNPVSGLCLDAFGGSSTDGTRIDLWTCGSGQANQQWTVPAAGSTSSDNLLVDPGAESVAICSPNGLDGMTVPGWTITSGMPNLVCYGASGYPDASTPGPTGRGTAFFAGGATGNSGLSQGVDVSAAAQSIDTGTVGYNLSGWLGGYAAQNDRVGLNATFLNAAGATLSTAQIAPVTSTDRGLSTALLQRTATGTVPAGTRSIKVDLAFTWTAGNTTDGYADNLSLTLTTAVPTPVLTAPVNSVPGYDHVFLVYMENENYENIIGNTSQAPYINSLLPQATSLTKAFATTHPSDPNYVALAGGGLYGLTDNSVSTTTINAPHLGNSVEQAGKTWKEYLDGANGNCDTSSHGYYAPDDAPFYYFQNMKSNAAYCQAHMQPLTQMTADLRSTATTPNFAWFAADDCNDMEACGTTAGDNWLKQTLPTILNSPAWTTQRSLLILTWDEGATKAYGPGYPNRIPTLLLGSQNTVKTGYQSSQRTDQYGLLRTIDGALGLNPLTNNDRYAATVNDAWQ